MCANPQSHWLNTIVVRAISSVKTKKTGGWSISPGKTKTETSLSF